MARAAAGLVPVANDPNRSYGAQNSALHSRPPSRSRLARRWYTFEDLWRDAERRERGFMRGWPLVTSIALVAGRGSDERRSSENARP